MRSYIKLDCAFFRHPKAVAAGRDGRDLFVAGLCYSGDMLTDGFIPIANLSILGVEAGVKHVKAAADALVGVGLWEIVEGGFKAHDYRDYNSAAEDVHAKRAAAKSRMQQMRSQDVRANKSRTDEDVRANNSIRSPNVQECSPDVREQEQYVQQYGSKEPNSEANASGEKPPKKTLPENGPAQEIVKAFCEVAGLESPATYPKAVGQAALMAKAGITASDIPSLYAFAAEWKGTADLGLMLSAIDRWRAKPAVGRNGMPPEIARLPHNNAQRLKWENDHRVSA